MSRRALWAIVPAKPFAAAKGRLAWLLSDAERAELARVMLDDVLRALLNSHSLAGTSVVTSDPDVAAAACRAGAEVLPEPGGEGLLHALAHAAGVLAAARHGGMLVVPSDVPLIRRADVDAIAAEHAGDRCATLVAASRDGGTNALACSPPQALPLCYGKNSFRRHHGAAMACGLATKVLAMPRVALDIDEPEDLLAFIEQPAATRTHAFLAASGIEQRVRRTCLPGGLGVHTGDPSDRVSRNEVAWP